MNSEIKSLIERYNHVEFKNNDLKGKDIRILLEDSIEFSKLCFKEHIQKYDPVNMFDMAGRMIRGVEEFINILNECDIKDFPKIVKLSVDVKNIKEFEEILKRNFKDLKLIGRIINVYLQMWAFVKTSQSFGLNLEITNIGEVMGYLQSRRAYLPTLQSLVLKYCKGKEKINSTEFISVFFPAIELYLMGIGSLSDYLTISYCLDDYNVKVNGKFPNISFYPNYEHISLESLFSQPMRIPLLEVLKHVKQEDNNFKTYKENNKIFSFKENIQSIDYFKYLFSYFKLAEDKLYNQYGDLLKRLEKYVLHDYYINISKDEMIKLIEEIFKDSDKYQVYDSLLMPNKEFIDLLNSKAPFVEYGDRLYSNVNLLTRFIYYYVENVLSKSKKYQIHSGFVFEKIVIDILKEHEFDVKNVTRIKNEKETYSEFDVISIKNNVIYNFQCKNNYLDISNIKKDNIKFKKENKDLIDKYDKAFKKEKEREKILLDKLKLKNIKHFVVSRFPVITRKDYILTFQKFEIWLDQNKI